MILLYIAEGLSKLCVITSTYLHTQEVLEDSLEYVSILYVQKLCHVCLANSTKHGFLGLLQFHISFVYFHSIQS